MWRRQLPASSPLPLRAVVQGALGLSGGALRARAAVTARLGETYGAPLLLLTDSGTGALALAMRGCLESAAGAAVAVPAYGCYDLATAADGAGVPVLLYDLDPRTLAPEMGSLHRALARGARAIVLVHPYGVPVDPEPVRALATRSDAWLIEDAAQGAGGRLRGRTLGAFGDVTVLSFGRGKGTTAGRGGALLAVNARGAEIVRCAGVDATGSSGVGELPRLAAQWLLGRPSLYGIPASLPFLRLGETIYRPAGPVRGMSDVAVSALQVTLGLMQDETETRQRNAMRLLQHCGAGLTAVRIPADAQAGYLRLPILASPEARVGAGARRAQALGIMPGYPQALCDLPGFGERTLNAGDAFDGARYLAERLITLPTHSLLSEPDLVRLESYLAAGGATGA